MTNIAQRNLPTLLADAHAIAERLSTATKSWPMFTPSVPALDDALNAAEGLKRTLNELRPHAAQLKAPRSA